MWNELLPGNAPVGLREQHLCMGTSISLGVLRFLSVSLDGALLETAMQRAQPDVKRIPSSLVAMLR